MIATIDLHERPHELAGAIARLDGARAIVCRGLLDAATCAAWVDGVLRARAEWTADFGGEQYALGRAFYTHLETDRAKEYFRDAAASDARVERYAPGLQARMRAMVAEVVAATAVARRGWCGPGVHVFPAGEKVAESGGVIHFDTEGLGQHHLARRKRALSVVAMLQPAEERGGIALWDVLWDGGDEAPQGEPEIVEYGVGDVLVFDSYRLHQIQPFAGSRDRISATVHAAEIDRGLWETWF